MSRQSPSYSGVNVKLREFRRGSTRLSELGTDSGSARSGTRRRDRVAGGFSRRRGARPLRFVRFRQALWPAMGTYSVREGAGIPAKGYAVGVRAWSPLSSLPDIKQNLPRLSKKRTRAGHPTTPSPLYNKWWPAIGKRLKPRWPLCSGFLIREGALRHDEG